MMLLGRRPNVKTQQERPLRPPSAARSTAPPRMSMAVAKSDGPKGPHKQAGPVWASPAPRAHMVAGQRNTVLSPICARVLHFKGESKTGLVAGGASVKSSCHESSDCSTDTNWSSTYSHILRYACICFPGGRMKRRSLVVSSSFFYASGPSHAASCRYLVELSL